MHKNWVIKGYDQSVTCLADDPQNLETRSSTLRTPGVLSQTNNNIHKQSSKETWVNLKQKDLTKKFNLRTPVCKKNQIKWSNETQTAKETRSITNLDLGQILQ